MQGILTRLVVKVGTSTLTNARGGMDRAFIADLTAQLAAQQARGCEVVLVSSGAIRAGKEALGVGHPAFGHAATRSLPNTQLPFPDTLPYKQAAAAIGQGLLMHAYTEAFAWRDRTCAQILLTRDDLSDRSRFLNARNTLRALLDLDVIPIINENDTVAVEEIKFGDNDTLAALVATLVEADLLLILSDVEGLYNRPPDAAPDPDAPNADTPKVISEVAHIDRAIASLGGDAQSGLGTGGMRTKIEAARIATGAGIRTVIARGRRANVIADVIENAGIGTTFLPRPDTDRLPARKRWIAHGARVRGTVTVNSRARERLMTHGVSLLAAGIVNVTGTFTSGDLIAIQDEAGQAFARGLTNYADSEIRRVLGLRSEQFEDALGYRGCDEIIHRDNLVLNE